MSVLEILLVFAIKPCIVSSYNSVFYSILPIFKFKVTRSELFRSPFSVKQATNTRYCVSLVPRRPGYEAMCYVNLVWYET